MTRAETGADVAAVEGKVRGEAGLGSFAPPWVSGGRIPGLDGLRGFSILIVTLSHVFSAPRSPFPRSWRVAVALGPAGVDIFFVISGFLITLLMLREMDRTGRISLADFYRRRALRILPAYVAYLAVVFAFDRLGWVTMDGLSWLAALTYTVNFIPDRMAYWCVGQVWSLSVEEHFYLAWPVALALLGRRKSLAVLGFWVVAAPAVRYVAWKYYRNVLDIDIFTFTRIDTIGVGCLLAVFVHWPGSWPLVRRLNGRPTAAAIASAFLLIVSINLLCRSGLYTLAFKGAVEASLIAIIILACACAADSGVGMILNLKPIVTLGLLSYSLYLWQPFLAPHGDRWPFAWPVNIALVVGGAVASHVLVERPFLRLKDRTHRLRARTPAAAGGLRAGPH